MSYFEIIIVAVVVLVSAGTGVFVWLAARAARKARNHHYQEFLNRKAQRAQGRYQ